MRVPSGEMWLKKLTSPRNRLMSSPHIQIRPEWLNRRSEPVIYPDQRIIDAHHHLWDRPQNRYLLDELSEDVLSGHRVIASIYVQCRSMYRADGDPKLMPVGEVEFANGIAAQYASGQYGHIRGCAGIIGFADLLLGSHVDEVLDHLEVAGGGRLKGIRNTTAWHADPSILSNPIPPPAGLLTQQTFIHGARCLGKRALVLDVWAYHTQLDEVHALARACPDTVIVIDHLGGPLGVGPYQGKRDQVFKEWALSIKKLAQIPNLKMKIGGFGLAVMGFDFHIKEDPPSSDELASRWKDYVFAVIDAFGTKRCMFESNFPVDKGMFSYVTMWNAYKKITSNFTQDDKDHLFYRTAAETYSINQPDS